MYSEKQHAISIVETNTKREKCSYDYRKSRNSGQKILANSRLTPLGWSLVTRELNKISLLAAGILVRKVATRHGIGVAIRRGGRSRYLTWSPNGAYVSLVGQGDIGDNGITFWTDHLHVIDITSGKRVLKRIPVGAMKLEISSVAWSPSDKFIAIGTTEGSVEVIELASSSYRI